MRIVLFYSGVDSFNYFTDCLCREFTGRNHEVFILNLQNPPESDPHSYRCFAEFLQKRVDMAVGFDGFGIKDDLFIELWDELGVTAVNILMDHPLRFHPTMEHHPGRYIQFCCDRNHVAYVEKYFSESVSRVQFMPHAGTPAEETPNRPFAGRKYDILLSGTYYRPQEQRERIAEYFPQGSPLYDFYMCMADYMLGHCKVTTEQALLDTIRQTGLSVQESQLKTMFRCSEPLDWMVRMYQRERVVSVLAEAGFDLWLLGRGWENHPCAGRPNVHRIDDRVPFAQTLPYMADAKLNLNVMPWFKAGTHDRIFNILLQHSLPLTDTSSWIDENFKAGEEIALYDLEELEKLPELAGSLLSDAAKAESMIAKGYEKVKNNFTWVNCADRILQAAGEEERQPWDSTNHF